MTLRADGASLRDAVANIMIDIVLIELLNKGSCFMIITEIY